MARERDSSIVGKTYQSINDEELLDAIGFSGTPENLIDVINEDLFSDILWDENQKEEGEYIFPTIQDFKDNNNIAENFKNEIVCNQYKRIKCLFAARKGLPVLGDDALVSQSYLDAPYLISDKFIQDLKIEVQDVSGEYRPAFAIFFNEALNTRLNGTQLISSRDLERWAAADQRRDRSSRSRSPEPRRQELPRAQSPSYRERSPRHSSLSARMQGRSIGGATYTGGFFH